MTAFLSRMLFFVDCQLGSMVTKALKDDVNSLDITGSVVRVLDADELELD
jgi:hypothetical protein